MGKLIDLTGQQFGRLTVLCRAAKPEGATSSSAFWLCRCECGKEKVISGNVLKQGKAKSCGCLNTEKRDFDSLVGKTFGRLTVLSRADKPIGVKGGDAYWTCRCECGKEVVVMGKSLKNGTTKSCGCYKHEKNIKDLTGMRFGKLVVLKQAGLNKEGRQLWECQCDCGNIHITNGRNLQLGICKSCGCLISSGEMEIEKILQDNEVNYSKQYTFKDLVSPKGGLLRFDFAIFEDNKLSHLIEFQGEQHYTYSGSYFDNPKINDELKDKYCREHKIPLILIPYWKRQNITFEDLQINKFETAGERAGEEE